MGINKLEREFEDILLNDKKWQFRFLEEAKLKASWSKDPSTKCGCVLVSRDFRIISSGFNGFPRKMKDKKELYDNREEKYSRIIHAEMNAILFAKESLDDCIVFTYPFLPCDRCCVHLIQAGAGLFVAPKATGSSAERWEPLFIKTRKMLKECGIPYNEFDDFV